MRGRGWKPAVVRIALAAAVVLGFGVVIVAVTDGRDDGEAPIEQRHVDPPAEADRTGAEPAAQRRWRSLAPSIFSRTEVGAARIRNRIYVVGGFIESGGTTRNVARYNIGTDRWKRIRPLPIAVNHSGVTSLRGGLFVLGGQGPRGGRDDAKSRRLYRYNPKRNRWRRLPDAPTARSALALAPIGRRLYAAGGTTEQSGEVRRLEIYDVERRRWRRGPPMPTGRNHVAAAAVGPRLYVIGGRPGPINGNQTTVESFKPGSGWRSEPPLTTARSGHAAAVVDRRIVVFGGEELVEGGETIGEVELLAPGRDAWRSLPDMITPRHGLGGASRGSRVFALEGGPRPGFAFSRALEFLDVP